jgi:PIN domain nuclease of toxin-antitoxin system
VRLLLDTHALLWWWNDDQRLSGTARGAIATPSNTLFVSAASAWEVATKARIGKLPELTAAVQEFLPKIEAEGFELLTITAPHAVRAGSYALSHGDPFDRMLAAQSELERIRLITRDPAFAAFPCETLW